MPIGDSPNAFRPLDAAAYLRLHGWREVDHTAERFSTWIKKDKQRGDFEVMLPLALHFHDLQQRILELFATLQAEEQRPLDEIVEDISTPNVDILRVRLVDAAADGCTLPVEGGAEVFQRTRDALVAAACSTLSRRAAFPTRKPETAMAFVREARFGQTKRGSYVITVLSPVTPALRSKQANLFETDDPFSRKAMRMLSSAIAASVQGAQRAAASGSVDGLLSSVKEGVSANLCDSLVGIVRASNSTEVQFTFSWAPARAETGLSPSSNTLSQDAVPYLVEASQLFKQSAELDEVEVSGVVTRLEHFDGQFGKVTVAGVAEGERRTVGMNLDGEPHAIAIKAYTDRLPIACVGELARDGKYYRLKNPRGFHILDEDE